MMHFASITKRLFWKMSHFASIAKPLNWENEALCQHSKTSKLIKWVALPAWHNICFEQLRHFAILAKPLTWQNEALCQHGKTTNRTKGGTLLLWQRVDPTRCRHHLSRKKIKTQSVIRWWCVKKTYFCLLTIRSESNDDSEPLMSDWARRNRL